MFVFCIHHSLNSLFSSEITFITVNKPSAVCSKYLHILFAAIDWLYQLVTSQSLSFYATCKCCYPVFRVVQVLTVSFSGSTKTINTHWLQACCVSAALVCPWRCVTEQHLCMAFSWVLNSSWKGYSLLRPALSLGERDRFLGKQMWKHLLIMMLSI